MRYFIHVVLIILVAFFAACESKKTGEFEGQKDQTALVSHARRFAIDKYEGYTLIRINKAWPGFDGEINYVLYNDAKPQLDSLVDAIYVKTPVQSIVSNSTTMVSFLEVLDSEESLTGFAQGQYIYSPKVRSLIDKGAIQEVGLDNQLDLELVLDIDPDMMMAFSARDENRQLKKLEELGVTIVMNADYMEKTVLGRAEWIKFIAAFVGKEEEGKAYFDQVVAAYDSLVNLTRTVNEKPTVFSGSLYGGSWFMPGGQNYGSSLIRDGGGQYLWSDNTQDGWLNLDFESVYVTAHDADFWIGAADFKSLSGMLSADERYGDFKALKEGKVYSYTNRVSSYGGNDYFESGNAKPHILLADMIKMIHPELLPDYELYYYKKLN